MASFSPSPPCTFLQFTKSSRVVAGPGLGRHGLEQLEFPALNNLGLLFDNKWIERSLGAWCTEMIENHSTSLLRARLHDFNHDRCGNDALRGSKRIYRFPCTFLMPTLQTNLSSQSFSLMSSTVCLGFDHDSGEEVPPLDVSANYRMDISLTNFVLQSLHETAMSVFLALKSQKSAASHLKVANAWVGVDVDVWHRKIAYQQLPAPFRMKNTNRADPLTHSLDLRVDLDQAAVYVLLKTVMEMGSMFDDKHLLFSILSPKVSLIMECIQSQLNKRDQNLVTWFRTEQLSILMKYFTPLLERWASEYGKSCLAVTVLATSCCVALTKLGAKRISCPAFTMSLPDLTRELMDTLHDSSSIDKLHCSATNAGFENEFLSHFGPKVLHHDIRGEVMFWMRLLEVKLVAAFGRESVITNLQKFCNTQVFARDLAVVGLFAFLGSKTRLFLLHMGIKDLDEPIEDFICYLECGILFLYPELSCVCVYQFFMEVVSQELGWLDLYAAVPCMRHQERKRSKQHAVQAEKEIILSTVFGVCSDMFSSFSHYSKKTQESLDDKLVMYLQKSENLLVVCIEDYWAAYDRLCGLERTTRVQFPEPMTHLRDLGTIRMQLECHGDLMARGITQSNPPYVSGINKSGCSDKILDELSVPEAMDAEINRNFFIRSSYSLLATIYDIWMGTRLLFVDIRLSVGLIQKHIFRGKLTQRERKKITGTLIDIACAIPLAILVLLPVTAIGHAAILTAIKTYIPHLIPSPFWKERLDIIKQLKRAKKMKAQSWSQLNVSSSAM